jgi:phosphatidylglycerol---prolipoprotein diacylglyceryl transferase
MHFTSLGIQIGPILLTFFGLILLTALVAGGYFAQVRARRHRQDMDIVIDVLVWGLVLGVIFGRVLYIWDPPPSIAQIYDRRWFLAHPFDLQMGPLAVWSGGLSVAGVLFGSLLGAFLVLSRRRIDRWLWADILAPAALMGLSIAPFANLVNQQMYGPPAVLPWAVHIQNPIPPFTTAERFHPTPAYLALWAASSLIVILWLEHRDVLRKGQLALVSVLLYAPGLFIADFLRLDMHRGLLGLTSMQLLALVLLAVSGAFLTLRRAQNDQTPVSAIANQPIEFDDH